MVAVDLIQIHVCMIITPEQLVHKEK